MLNSLVVYSPEDMTPRQFDVIRTLLDEYRQERGGIYVVQQYDGSRPDKVLVFGSAGPYMKHTLSELQYTYSLKQFESRANARTVFFAALDTYFENVKGLGPDVDRLSFFAADNFVAIVRHTFDLSEPIAVDVETGGILGETVTPRTAPLLSISMAQGATAIVYKMRWNPGADHMMLYCEVDEECWRREDLPMLQELLQDIEKPIFHNGKFDITVIENNLGIRMPNWFDTMLAHHVLNHAAREHGLKAVCKRYFNAEDWEHDIKKSLNGSKNYGDISPDVLAHYSAYDVLWTYRLWEYLSVMIDADDAAQTALYLEMQMADFLMEVEATGIPVSETDVDELLIGYEQSANQARQKLVKITRQTNFNPGSWQQVKRWLEEMGVPVSSTDEESIKAIREVYKDIAQVVVDFCDQLLLYRKAVKMHGTYVQPWWKAAQIEGDSRVHPTFHVHGTTTGRLSSSDPNAQNVPREKTIRKMVTINEQNQLV